MWFDKNELRGGDIWDRQIEDRIHDCRLFIPLISANTEHRDEGYFRREWGQHRPDLLGLKVDPLLARLRTDERYKGLLRRMNLPE